MDFLKFFSYLFALAGPLYIFGGGSSSSQSLTNSISFNPILNIGDGNEGSTSAEQKSKAESTATTKDEFGMSAGVAVGSGASASGGAVGNGDDVQPTRTNQANSSAMLGGFNMMYVALGLVGLGGGYYFIKKKKKK